MESEAEQRARVVEVARTWLGTPYRHSARVKGHGADCLTLLAEVYAEAGLVEKIAIPHYPPDWHLHKTAERYLQGLLKYTNEIPGPPKPADIVLWKFGHCFSHGAIVVEWPTVIHAYVGMTTTPEDAEKAMWLTHIGESGGKKVRPKRFFSIWG